MSRRRKNDHLWLGVAPPEPPEAQRYEYQVLDEGKKPKRNVSSRFHGTGVLGMAKHRKVKRRAHK